MAIVDAQLHIWAANTPERPWVATGREHRSIPVSADDLLQEMDGAGVDAAILVPPSFEGNRNDLALTAAAAHPDRFAVMGRIDLDSPEEGAEIVRTWRAQPGALGFRLILTPGSDATHPRPGSWLTDGEAEWFFEAASEAGVPVMLHVIGLLTHVRDVARRYPDLKLIVDHFALPSNAKIERDSHLIDEIQALSKFANVAVKASGLPCYTDEQYPFPTWQHQLHRIIDWFGPHRVFWGSDLTRLPCSYQQMVEFFTSQLDFLDDADRRWILGDGLQAWLGWQRPQSTQSIAAG